MNQLVPFTDRAPALVAAAGARASYRFLEFFTAQIRNPNAYRRCNKDDPRRKPRAGVKPSGTHRGTSEPRLRAFGLPARVPRGRPTKPCAEMHRRQG